MLVIATCRHSAYLELALKGLENAGISKNNLLVAPLDKQGAEAHTGKVVDGQRIARNPVDLTFIFAMVMMLLGAIYGFVLAWGPIICATIGLVLGGLLGYGVDYLRTKNLLGSRQQMQAEVVVLVYCERTQTDLVAELFWQNGALGVSKVASYT